MAISQRPLPIPSPTDVTSEQKVINGEIVRLTPQSQPETVALTLIGAKTQTHIGPLPSAEQFAKYEEAVPGVGNRIVQMAEIEQAHRQRQDILTTRADIGLQYLGLLSVVAISAGGLVGAVYLTLQGYGKYGLGIMGMSLIGILVMIIRALIAARKGRDDLGQVDTSLPASVKKKTQHDKKRR